MSVIEVILVIIVIIIVLLCACLCLAFTCNSKSSNEQEDLENGFKSQDEYPTSQTHTTRVYYESDSSEREEETKKENILRVKSPYKNGYHQIPIPPVLYRRHFHRNLSKQNALFLSKRRKGDLVENTVFEDPGRLLECRLVGRNLISRNSNEVFYVSPMPLRRIQCYYDKKHYKWTKADDLDYKWAVFKSQNNSYHFEKKCLQYDKVLFT